MDLIVRTREALPPGRQEVEVVERKGLGHPDTICDAVAEQVCVRLCRHYLQHFGRILHHNVDKVLLVGGAPLIWRWRSRRANRNLPGRPSHTRVSRRRGNRTWGPITPYRPMTLEAAAGKNPVSHVGKLYNLVAGRVAAAIVATVPHVTDAECMLVSQIGRAASDPQVVDVCLACDDDTSAAAVHEAVADIVKSQLQDLPGLREALLDERVQVF